MLEDVQEALNSYIESNKSVLTERDLLGVNKINFELELLFRHTKKSRKKSEIKDSSEAVDAGV